MTTLGATDTIRVRLQQRPGAFARVAAAIGETGAILGAIDLVRVERGEVVRDVTMSCVDAAHARRWHGPRGASMGWSWSTCQTGRS